MSQSVWTLKVLMAKVKIKGVQKLASSLNANMRVAVNKLMRDANLRDKIGSIIVKDIKENVDMGAASPVTVKIREYFEKYNVTDPAYSRSRVKAVFTGQLMEDLRKNVKSITTEMAFEVKNSDKKHKGYKTKNGKTKGESFSKISGWIVDDLGYNYFQLTQEAQAAITNEVQNVLFKILSSTKSR